MSHKTITCAIFLVSALSFQQSWAGNPEACNDKKFAEAHKKDFCAPDGIGIGGQQEPGWGNNGEAKKKLAETVAANKAKQMCKQKFSDPVKLKKCIDENVDP